MTKIAFLACETTLPGEDQRRADAFEHDLMVGALEPAFAAHELELTIIDWEADMSAFNGIALAILGTSWNYQDKPGEFLAKLGSLEQAGIKVCNSSEIVGWNSRKTYLKTLADRGAATIPTLWLEHVGAEDIARAMDRFECDKLVIKRQIGAGALGQEIHSRDAMPDSNWRFEHAAMLQPFIASIQRDGELSFIFIDGAFSHALRKTPAANDYRIQSLYGGTETALIPSETEIEEARRIMRALPFADPLYARIDMLRSGNGQLLLMEAELVEPYLYPEQGPQLGEFLARAIAKRIS